MTNKFVARKSRDLIKFTLKQYKFKNKLALALYALMSFLGKSIFFTKPIFDVADDNLARMIVETHYINFPMLFEGVTKRYGKLLLADTIHFFEALVTIIFIFVIPFLVVSLLPNAYQEITPGHIICYALLAVSLIISYLISTKYWAVPHVLLSNSNITASDAMLISRINKKKYAGRVFATRLPYYLLVIVYLALTIGEIFVFALITNYENLLIISAFAALLPLLFLIFWLLISYVNILRCVKTYLIYKETIPVSKPIVAKQISGDKLDYVPLFEDEEISSSIINGKGGK